MISVGHASSLLSFVSTPDCVNSPVGVAFRNYNSQNKWEKCIVQKKLGSFYYLIKYNNKVVKKHLDQLRPNYIKSNSNHDPSDIVSEIPCDNNSLRKLINHPVSQDTASVVKSSNFKKKC